MVQKEFVSYLIHTCNSGIKRQSRINDNELRPVIYTFFVVGALNVIGCSFVFYKTFIKWKLCKKDGKELTMSYRLFCVNQGWMEEEKQKKKQRKIKTDIIDINYFIFFIFSIKQKKKFLYIYILCCAHNFLQTLY